MRKRLPINPRQINWKPTLSCLLLVCFTCTVRIAACAGTTVTVAGNSGGASASRDRLGNSENEQPSALKIKLPFQAGQSYEVLQGNHGDFTHVGFNEYAFDFRLPENTPVCAAAAGRVVRVKQDGTAGGPSNEFFGEGNCVVIDHGNGLYSQYLHLAPHSARVKEGDLVSGAQVIAKSGNTGYSSMPHLHFDVQDATGRSVLIKFQDVAGSGIPVAGSLVTSANDGTGTAQYTGESYLPPDVFSHNSIVLITRDLPGHLFRTGREYRVRGRLTGSTAHRIAVYFMGVSGGAAIYTIYANLDKDGFFEVSFDPEKVRKVDPAWEGDTSQSNMFSLAIAPVAADGSFWSDVSVPICVR